MSIDLATMIITFSLIILIISIYSIQEKIKTKKYEHLYVCIIIAILGALIPVSFIICSLNYKEGPAIYTEHPIQMLTIDAIYFDDKCYYCSDSHVIIEEPNNEYENVIVVENKKIIIPWVLEVTAPLDKIYHVYLSEENYNKFQNRNIIYQLTP